VSSEGSSVKGVEIELRPFVEFDAHGIGTHG
jgi:hypothetical protein